MSRKKNNVNNKKLKKSKINVTVIVCFIIAAILTFVIFRSVRDAQAKNELCNYGWISTSAENSNADEVEMSEIYNNNYSSYQGNLNFDDDLTFSLWLTPGSPDDGTHSGSYKIVNKSTLEVTFDDTTQTSFEIIRDKNGEISSIVVPFNEYKVYFTKQ